MNKFEKEIREQVPAKVNPAKAKQNERALLFDDGLRKPKSKIHFYIPGFSRALE